MDLPLLLGSVALTLSIAALLGVAALLVGVLTPGQARALRRRLPARQGGGAPRCAGDDPAAMAPPGTVMRPVATGDVPAADRTGATDVVSDRASRSAAILLAPAPGAAEHSPRGTMAAGEAVVDNASLRPLAPVELPEGARVLVTYEYADGGAGPGAEAGRAFPAPGAPSADDVPPTDLESPDVRSWLLALRAGAVRAIGPFTRPGPERAAWWLFALSLIAYLASRLWGLDRYPIYFFTDEAFYGNRADELLTHGLHDGAGNFLPVYYEAAAQRWTPVLAAYLHVVTEWLFGRSVFVVRATTVLATVLCAVAVAGSLKAVFRARYWWAGVLLLAAAPAWFLHSRTGFETAIAASWYACFVLCYLLYRSRSPRYLYAAVVAGALSFYTYSNSQVVMAAAAVLLLISDLRYHWQQRRTVAAAFLLALVLAVPLLAFQKGHPGAMANHLKMLGSYLYQDLPPAEKMQRFLHTYADGLSPAYWFDPGDSPDITRHRMLGRGHLAWWSLPLILAGLAICLRRVRQSPYRVLLLALAAGPIGAATASVGITRVLMMVPPAVIVAGLGLEAGLVWLERRVPRTVVAGGTFLLLAAATFWLARDALVNGALWYRDYGLYGMQWGSRVVFQDLVPRYLAESPARVMHVSSEWANAPEKFIPFFVPGKDRGRVQITSVDSLLHEKSDLSGDRLFVLTQPEVERAVASGHFKTVDVRETVAYPDGSPGFHVVRLEYADDIDDRLASERVRRRVLDQVLADVGGQTVNVRHSRLDMGRAPEMFDGDTFTFARGQEANPFVVELEFPKPRVVAGIAADFSPIDLAWTIGAYPAGSTTPITYTYKASPRAVDVMHVEYMFPDGPRPLDKLRIETMDEAAGELAHVHARELRLIGPGQPTPPPAP